MKVIGKHRELLIELLIYYLDNMDERINYYKPQHNNPEHTDEENNDNGQT